MKTKPEDIQTDLIQDIAQPDLFKVGQAVDLIIWARTDLGYKAVVNGAHWGVLYSNEVFQELRQDQELTGYIKQVRQDGRIDLILQKMSHKAGEDIAPLILELLKKSGGRVAINDKTPAEKIYELFGVSKKKYKIALGGLYKKRLIKVDDDGIELIR